MLQHNIVLRENIIAIVLALLLTFGLSMGVAKAQEYEGNSQTTPTSQTEDIEATNDDTSVGMPATGAEDFASVNLGLLTAALLMMTIGGVLKRKNEEMV
jgi:hypothetical protein